MRKYNQGWREESSRHSLSAKGVKTGRTGRFLKKSKNWYAGVIAKELTAKGYLVVQEEPLTIKTKVKLGNGEVVDAVLWGVDGGDLFGGRLYINGEWLDMDKDRKRLPKGTFPFNGVAKTPFVDLPVAKNVKAENAASFKDIEEDLMDTLEDAAQGKKVPAKYKDVFSKSDVKEYKEAYKKSPEHAREMLGAGVRVGVAM